MLATVLFTDIVDATKHLAEVGDHAWKEVLAQHHFVVRKQLDRYRGREIDTAGDGFLAAFDGPARAVRCAQAISDGVKPLGISVRAGVHTGECEIMGEKLGGIAVHIGSRIASLATAGEVLVSSTVKDLVAGAGIRFEQRGSQHSQRCSGRMDFVGRKLTHSLFSAISAKLNGGGRSTDDGQTSARAARISRSCGACRR